MVLRTYTYDNIYDFYKESDILTKEGNPTMFKEMCERDNVSWVGLGLDDIKKSKYSYDKGLENLKEIELDTLGGSSTTFKYDEFDGDDLNYDRLLEGFPALRKRIRTSGIGTGRIINIYINIAEHCGIGYRSFLIKAYTAMRLIDTLEKLGYRTAVYSCVYIKNLGTIVERERNENLDYVLEACVKKAEDPLIKGLLLTCISPWFFRYHIFKHMCAKHKTNCGLGRPGNFEKKSTKENIYIDNGECLTENDAEKKIKEIMSLFEN